MPEIHDNCSSQRVTARASLSWAQLPDGSQLHCSAGIRRDKLELDQQLDEQVCTRSMRSTWRVFRETLELGALKIIERPVVCAGREWYTQIRRRESGASICYQLGYSLLNNE